MLPQALVERNGHGIGKIMATRMLTWHGYGPQSLAVFFIKLWRQAMSLIAEHQIVAYAKLAVIEAAACLGTAEPEVFRMTVFIQKILPILIYTPMQEGPIVQPRPFQMRLIQTEAQGLYQMQLCVRADAQTTYSTCVLRYLRRNQNYVEARTEHPRQN